MRVLFGAVPAHGHLLPLAPLMRAALEAGHAAAVVTSAGVAAVVREELPHGVEHLPAGPMPLEFSLEGARVTGHDLMSPMDAETVGQIFGGARLDATIEPALAAATDWRPDVVVVDMYDTVGPMIAAARGVPWHLVQITVGVPPSWGAEIDRVTAPRYAARGLAPIPAATRLDPWPPIMRDPSGRSDAVPTRRLRARAHHRDRVELPTFSEQSRPRVLVTLGTVFSDSASLAAIVDAVAGPEVDVLATLGRSLHDEPIEIPERDDRRGEVRAVPFAPMDQLLEGTSVVVGVGGAGTVLAALSHGVPLVLWPRGAETPVIAERARAAGVAITIDDPTAAGAAVTAVLADPGFRQRAVAAAEQIAEAPDAPDVLSALLADLGCR